jgi:hypothetical protein
MSKIWFVFDEIVGFICLFLGGGERFKALGKKVISQSLEFWSHKNISLIF